MKWCRIVSINRDLKCSFTLTIKESVPTDMGLMSDLREARGGRVAQSLHGVILWLHSVWQVSVSFFELGA